MPRRACSIYAAWAYEVLVQQVLPENRPLRGGPSVREVAAAAPEGFHFTDADGQRVAAEKVSTARTCTLALRGS